MTTDLTEIVETVVQEQWDIRFGYAETAPWSDQPPQDKVAVKNQYLAVIAHTARLVEAEVRRQIRLKLDSVPRADLGGMTISVEDALAATR